MRDDLFISVGLLTYETLIMAMRDTARPAA